MAISQIEGILPKGPYPRCLRMADRALLAGYPRYNIFYFAYQKWYQAILTLHLFGMMDNVYMCEGGRNGIVFHQTMEQINHWYVAGDAMNSHIWSLEMSNGA